jgi:DNA-directed RNA polymerase subunit RPC12/RpoP
MAKNGLSLLNNNFGGIKMTKARCMRCKKEVEMKDGKEVVMKNGMKAMKGICPTCSTKCFRILGKAK